MTAPKKPTTEARTKSARPHARARSRPSRSRPTDDLEDPAGDPDEQETLGASEGAAEALERLSKMTPEEQAAALFQTILASSGKKSW